MEKLDSAQQHTVDCCDAWCTAKSLPTYTELLTALNIITLNAVIGPDASMNGCTDCYHVPVDDIEAARKLIDRT